MTLLAKIEIFMRTKHIPPTRFGREAVNDPRLVFDLRQGREMGQRMRGRVEAYLKGALQ